MAYQTFQKTKPDPSADNGVEAFDNTRENMLALRDAVIIGVFQAWPMKPYGSDLSQPASTVWSNGVEHIKGDYTYGSAGDGGGEDNVLEATYSYSSNGGTSYATVGVMAITYDSSANVTGTTWS